MATMVKAIMIPHDMEKPVEVIDYNRDDYREITRRVTAGGDGTFSMMSFPRQKCAVFFDDEGLYTQPENVNTRAMALVAELEGVRTSDLINLVGDYMVVGPADGEGNTLDVPVDVVTMLIGKRVQDA